MINLKPSNFIKSGTLTQSKAGEVYSVSVPAAGYMYYVHPVPLSLGDRVEASVNVKVTSGSDCKLAVEFIDNYTDGFATGGGVQGFDEYTSITNDLNILKADGVVPPSKRYFRVILGYFGGASTGDFEFSNLQITTTAPKESLIPELTLKKSLSLGGGAVDFIGKFDLTTFGSATATLIDDYYEMVSAADGSVIFELSASSAKWANQEGAKIAVIKCNAKVFTGGADIAEPMMRLRYIDSGGAVSLEPYRIACDDFENHYAMFALPGDVIRVNAQVGIESFAIGKVQIKSFSLDIYGSEKDSSNLFSKIRKSGANFLIDNGAGRGASNGITSISQTVDTITLLLDSDREHSHIPIVQMEQFPNGEDYRAIVNSVTTTQIDIRFIDSSTNLLVNLAAIPDGSRFNLIAFGNY